MKRPHFKNLRSMKYRMWLYFALFAALTLTLVWLLQVVFLGNYYEPMKLNEITNIGRQLEQAAHREGIFSFGTYSYPSETLREMMQEQSYKNGVTVMIIKIDLLSGKGMAVYSPQLENDTQSTPASIITNEDYTRYVDKLNAADGTSVSYINKNTKFNSKTAVFGTVLANSGIYRYTLYGAAGTNADGSGHYSRAAVLCDHCRAGVVLPAKLFLVQKNHPALDGDLPYRFAAGEG